MYYIHVIVFFFKQKTAYEMRISDWSSDVCSSDLTGANRVAAEIVRQVPAETPFQAHAGSGFDVSEAHGVAGDQVVPPARPDCPFGEPLVLAFDGELERPNVVQLEVPAEEAVDHATVVLKA